MKIAHWTLVATIVVVGISATQSSFAQTVPNQVNGNCNSCQGGSHSGLLQGHGGGFANWKENHRQHRAEASAMSKKIYERNEAWPKPFECWDRTSYFNVWSTMYYSGLAAHCTFSDAHFDSETGELNRLGERKIATIMQNNAELQRGFLVVASVNPQVTEKRLDNVKAVVRKWYGDDVAQQVATTNVVPRPGSGSRIEAINAGYNTSMQAPSISAGSSSSSSSSGNTSGSSN